MKFKFLIPLFFLFVIPAFLVAQQTQIDVTTVLSQQFLDKNGNPLTGKGVLIGDVDSGIDIFHPMFFFADGGEYDWIDVNGDGKFTPGTDGVDLNHDGKIEPDEILRYIELKDDTWNLLPGYETGKFDPEYDFLYVDKNGNKKRDYGPQAGFTEKDPTYGEPLFIAIDANHNGKLDAGEKIIALKTSKVRAVCEKDGTIRRRGVDLINTEEDSSGHGTGVAGLILGGENGVQKLHGLAPDAEIVVVDIQYDYTPRFVRHFPDMINFLKDEKVNILLIEDGEWMWEFMDGSTPEEQLMDQMARDGTTVIGGSGNLATGDMVLIDTLTKGETENYRVECEKIAEGKINDGMFMSFLWRNTDNNISFSITTPDRQTSPELNTGSDFIKVGSYNIFYSRDVSAKGTAMFRFTCSKQDSSSVGGSWKITVKSPQVEVVRGYVVDVSQSWSGTSHWVSRYVTGESSVTFPSTADSCLAVGAYVVNLGWFDKIGGLASYSSRGYNLDGKLGVDITAPGHTTLTTEANFGWQIFSGTSSAAPHVVGTVALLLQYNPALTFSQIRQILRSSATSDKFTGTVPNTNWGYGKLNIEGAIKYLMNNY
jgi:subtilisin family serine protease